MQRPRRKAHGDLCFVRTALRARLPDPPLPACRPHGPSALRTACRPHGPSALRTARRPHGPSALRTACRPHGPSALRTACRPHGPSALRTARRPHGPSALRTACRPHGPSALRTPHGRLPLGLLIGIFTDVFLIRKRDLCARKQDSFLLSLSLLLKDVNRHDNEQHETSHIAFSLLGGNGTLVARTREAQRTHFSPRCRHRDRG